jgi:hypothetical protein
MKLSYNQKEIWFSEWLESTRKDVECTFGILKGCCRILKSGIHLHGTKPADAIFKTCCALHNWLLEVDGLNKGWENGETQSQYLGDYGEFDPSDPATAKAFAMCDLSCPAAQRTFDLSGI